MARTRTRAELRTEARQRADQENSTFCSDTEVNRYLNEAYTEFWDWVLAEMGMEFWLTNTTFVSVADTREYNLPSDYYLLLGVEVDTGDANDPVLLRPYMFQERYQGVSGATHPGRHGWASDAMYRLFSSVNATTGAVTHKIRFSVAPDGGDTVRVWYIPHAPDLDSDTDVVDGMNGWEEYLAVSAAIRMVIKEEGDPSGLLVMLDLIKKRIKALASYRDMGHNLRVWEA